MKEIPKFLLENLCYNNPQNPDCCLDEEDKLNYNKDEECYCDNCFHGRTKLAEFAIILLKENENKI